MLTTEILISLQEEQLKSYLTNKMHIIKCTIIADSVWPGIQQIGPVKNFMETSSSPSSETKFSMLWKTYNKRLGSYK